MECGQKTKQNKDGYKKATCIVRAELDQENGSLQAKVGVGTEEKSEN